MFPGDMADERSLLSQRMRVQRRQRRLHRLCRHADADFPLIRRVEWIRSQEFAHGAHSLPHGDGGLFDFDANCEDFCNLVKSCLVSECEYNDLL